MYQKDLLFLKVFAVLAAVTTGVSFVGSTIMVSCFIRLKLPIINKILDCSGTLKWLIGCVFV